jgi:hypothetical protein
MNKKIKIMFLCFSFALFQTAKAQVGNLIYTDSILHRIDVDIDIPNWIDTLDNDYSKNIKNPNLYPEVYRECNIVFDGSKIMKCGIREKGATSNQWIEGNKKPFKIAFDAFVEQRFDGIKKINLNNFNNDPSLLKEATVFKLMRDAGLNASRTAYAELYVNNEYWGVYILIENVDKTFLRMKFGGGNNDGNLYKKDNKGSMFPAYLKQFENDSLTILKSGMKLSTNEDLNDWGGYLDFIDFLNNSSDEDFKQNFEKRFDVSSYLKQLAIEKLVRANDTYWREGNNFYLYEHPDGKMYWIPWDVNETFVSIKFLEWTGVIDGYLVQTKKLDDIPLVRRILAVPEWKNKYLQSVCEILQSLYDVNLMGRKMVQWHELVDEAYDRDPNKFNTYEDFTKSLTEDYNDYVSVSNTSYRLKFTYPGLFPMIVSQKAWAMDQMKGWDFKCGAVKNENQVQKLVVYPNPVDDKIYFKSDSTGFNYAQISICNLGGKEVGSNFRAYNESDFVDVSALIQGFYIITKIDADGKVSVGKFIKQ